MKRKYVHELRAPVNSFNVILALMEKDLSNIEEVKKYINQLKMTSNYLLMLIQEVLELDELEKGSLKLNEIEFDILLYLEDLMPIFEQYISYMGKKFSFKIDKLKQNKVIGDKTRFIQIILNFLSNAEKYSRLGDEILFEVIDENITENNIVEITFLISDTGIGMSEDFVKNKFFMPYQQANKSNKGNGLGGYITSELVNLLNGKVTIDSKLDEGTKIYLTLPFKIIESNNIDKKRHNVLFVDDDIFTRDLVKSVLEEFKISVDFAVDGFDALDKINKKNYELIFIDIEMPSMNGIECIKNIKNKTGHWIAMSAHNNFDYEKHGFDEFLIKPFMMKELIEKLNYRKC